MSSEQPIDDLSDDVTMAADADLVDQIRRKAAAHRAPGPDTPAIAGTADDVVDDLDDDLTVPAPKAVVSTVSRRAVQPQPVEMDVDVENPESVAVDLRDAAHEPRATPVFRPAPQNHPVASSFASPFDDDGISLIDQQRSGEQSGTGGSLAEDAWEPPSRFVAEPATAPASAGPSVWKLVALLAAAVILTAIATAVIVLALTESS